MNALISMGPRSVLELLNSETSLVDFLTSLGPFCALERLNSETFWLSAQ